jgi:membrane fusion protein, heavy metal efflux system
MKFHTPMLAALTASLLLSSCNKKPGGEAVSAGSPLDTTISENITIHFSPEQYRLADIETGSIDKRILSHLVKVNGVVDVEPAGIAVVSAPLGGYIQTPGLLPGEKVRKGQVLAKIENPEFITLQQQYLEGRARLEYLQQEFERQKSLREEDVNAAKTFQKVASDYKVAQATVEGLALKLAQAGVPQSALNQGTIVRIGNLYAPIDGYIKTSNVNIGKYVNPTDVLFELVNEDDLHLALNVFEGDAHLLLPDQTVKFSRANESDFNRTARVFLAGKSTENGNTIPVHCHIEKDDMNGLLPGMYVKAWIETTAEVENAVPSDAIVNLEGRDYLVVQTDTTKGFIFQLVRIKRGVEQEAFTAVTLPASMDPLHAMIVIRNAYVIISAIKIREEQEE